MIQRSADIGLGIPFNVGSYALLTKMIAEVCKLKTGDLIIVMGDTHIYKNHIEALKIQITRKPNPFPTLYFSRQINDIDDFKYEDFILKNYNPHMKLEMNMAA